jgi:hypothetical protein
MQRRAGVTAIATVFILIATLLCGSGVTMLISPKALSAMRGFRALEMDGPFGALLVGVVWGLIGWGLFLLRDWARLAAMLVIAFGAAWELPRLVTASHFHWWLVWGGLEIVVRLIAVWYLFRTPVAQCFSKRAKVA